MVLELYYLDTANIEEHFMHLILDNKTTMNSSSYRGRRCDKLDKNANFFSKVVQHLTLYKLLCLIVSTHR